jgi:hypothetical protein
MRKRIVIWGKVGGKRKKEREVGKSKKRKAEKAILKGRIAVKIPT